MKTMTIEQLKKRGKSQGDIYYMEHEYQRFNGWYLEISDNELVGLSTNDLGAWGEKRIGSCLYKFTKAILREDISKGSFKDIAHFLRTFDESLIEHIITKIVNKPLAKYIHAVHFGSTKLYTWRVPEEFADIDFRTGDIVEVDTIKGRQYVEVREIADYEFDEKTKEITKLIKVCGYTRGRFE